MSIGVAVLAACAHSGEGARQPHSEPSRMHEQPPRGRGPMKEVRASTMAPALAEMGLDLRDLPPIETLDHKRKLRVMKTFSDALGLACVDCHAGEDFAADTRRKRVAKRMWNEITRVVTLESGEPVYCDSCHQGVLFPLDRRDKGKVSAFMSDVFVDKMKRADGKDHACETCHGDPPEFAFLATWKSSPAPDLQPVPRSNEPAAMGTPPLAADATPSSTPSPTTAKPPAPKRQPVSVACGEKKNPCPLQKWMRQNVATAVAAKDTAALAKALDRLATLAPDPSWTSWVEMSKTAAAAARSGDMTEARKSCQGCHNAYKAKWLASHRTRPVQ